MGCNKKNKTKVPLSRRMQEVGGGLRGWARIVISPPHLSTSLLSPRPRPVPIPVPVPSSPPLSSPHPFRPRRPRVVSLSSTLDPPYEQGLVAVVVGLPRPRCGPGHGRGRHLCPSPVPHHPVGAPTTPTRADARCGGAGAGLVPSFPRLGSLPPFLSSSSHRPFRCRPPIVVVPSFSLSSPCSCRPLIVVVPVPGRHRPVIVVSRFTRHLKICW